MKEKKQKLIDITTVKFLLVGVINTLVGTGTMFGLYNCELFSEQVFYF